ncbi:MAG TPA: alpha-L-arabinofuranosidase C-terminal domain-containing protein [Verrucomicrobiae bacterium]|jgi:alpha-L-arabinofuranosidase
MMLGGWVVRGQSTATVSIQADQPGPVVSSNLFGIFFEEINFAGEGGIYAEMVRNRAFYSATNAYYWTLITHGTAVGTMSVDATQPLNTNIVNSLKLTKTSGTGSVGAGNAGFWGMNLQAGATYNLNFYAKSASGFAGPIVAQLENAAGTTVYAQASFNGLIGNWQKFSASLIPNTTDTNAQLVLSISQAATVWVDVVSLFPAATYNNRTNGLRADLVNMLSALHPSFLRYPGGNFIEGQNLTNAVRWKKTIGDISQRPGHLNDAWGYWSTDGFGYEEFLQFCEDMNMQPLYGINCGLALGFNGDTNNTVPASQLGPWVQDALDAIQYANGDTNTTWGAVRAANGHPAPFNLQYIEIGNENGGPYYNTDYGMFYNAIKSNYPSIHIIAPDWGGIPSSAPVEIEDQHYYASADTFDSFATMYDNYDRNGPKVFIGEYAVTAGYGADGNLSSALGEAAFMTGMERNSDVVQMASYAPLFANLNGTQWLPDMIYYDSARGLFGTPSYYVQELFGQNRGDVVLPGTAVITTNSAGASSHGAIGVGSWNTSVQYTNIVVTSNGVTLYQSDFVNQGTNGWNVFNGTWSTNNGLYQQTAITTDCYSTSGDTNWANYTISLQARKVSGNEGFLILFNVLDTNNFTWWNVGGWNNTLDGIEQTSGGNKATLAQVSQSAIANNTWYNLSVTVSNAAVYCYLNGALVQALIFSNGFYTSTTYSKSSGQIIVKAVNPNNAPMVTTFKVSGVGSIAPEATLIQLTSASAEDANSLAAPAFVFPVTNSISNAGTNFTLTLPANSLSVLRLAASGINNYTNLLLQIPSPITNDITVASTLWGQQSGNSIDLTANSNHAITWFSSNTNVAVVDDYGNVTGVGLGAVDIIATYPALGLSATQLVQVINIPATLMHRYSMNETSGTIVTDSIGGPAWNGTLPNGGTFGSGQLSFSASGQQYLNLPGGILSNYLAATIEMWIPGISGATSSPPFVYLFAFGNTDSGGNGYDCLFFNPNVARATISSADPGFDDEQGGNLPSLGFAANLHLTCVFDCPAGTILVYTNGVLVASFSGITDPLSIVGNQFAYVGRSLYTLDAYLNWSLQELRIYDGTLSAAEIEASDALGPGQLLNTASPEINPASLTGNNLTLSWPVAAASFTLQSSTNLASGAWADVSPPAQIVGNQWQVTIPVSANAQFFRLAQ